MILGSNPSQDIVARCLLDLQDALDAIRDEMLPRMESVAWPAGLDRAVLHGLPLQVRTRNCLENERLMQGDNPLTVNQLLSIPNFGRTSLQDLLFTVEEFLRARKRVGPADSRDPGEEPESTPRTPEANAASGNRARESRTSWECATRLLRLLFATAAEVRSTETLAEALAPEFLRLGGQNGARRRDWCDQN